MFSQRNVSRGNETTANGLLAKAGLSFLFGLLCVFAAPDEKKFQGMLFLVLPIALGVFSTLKGELEQEQQSYLSRKAFRG